MSMSLAPRHFQGGCVAALMLVLLFVSDVQAYNPFGRGDKDSTALINARSGRAH